MAKKSSIQLLGVAGGPIFSGVIDGLAAAVSGAYSTARRMTGTSWGTVDSVLNPICRLRRLSDNNEETFTYDSTTDELDASAVSTFLSATTGVFVKIYDQSGNGRDATNATAAEQPGYIASGIGSKPTSDYVIASLSNLVGTLDSAVSGDDLPFSIYSVSSLDVASILGTPVAFTKSGDSNNNYYIPRANSGQWRSFKVGSSDISTITTGTTDTNDHYHIQTHTGTTTSWRIDGVALFTDQAQDTNAMTVDQFVIGGRVNAFKQIMWDGQVSEAIYFASEISSGDITALESSASSFYGI